jgi:cellulose synthase/poly-beta-1,6-N-acetylglucosamine synthase-like glycosyltransferase
MKLSIVMPAYNERKTLREIVGRVLAVDLGPIEKELVIVDDGSTDGTRDILRELDGKDGVRRFQPGTWERAPCGRGCGATGDVVVIRTPIWITTKSADLLRPILAGGRHRLQLPIPQDPDGTISTSGTVGNRL